MNSSDFEPPFEWLHHPDSHVLTVHLQGFRTDQLKVQVTVTRKLRITGEQRLESGKWLGFLKEIGIPTDANSDKVSAKFEEGILYVKLAKNPSAAAVSSTNPPAQQPKPTTQPQPPPAAAAKPKTDPPKPPTAKPTIDPPTVRQNAPQSQNNRPESQVSKKQIPSKPTENRVANTSSVRQNAPRSQNEKTQAQKAMDKTEKKTEEEDGVEESRRWRRREDGYKKVIDGMMKELRTNILTLVFGLAVSVIVYLNVTNEGHPMEEEW